MCSSGVAIAEQKSRQRERWRDWYARNHERANTMKAAAMRRYRAADPEKYRKQSRDAKARLKSRLLQFYGSTCAVCGFADARALTLDHVNGNGNAERKRIGERGVYQRALETYLPDEYRTLCMNCQFIQRVK
jgi:hypothetical protein